MSHQPKSARGTSGMTSSSPTVVSANPAQTMVLARRLPAIRPASIATANMLSDSGARESPACIALYSRVICRKSGSTIIAPPRVICWSICWVTPSRKCGRRNRSGSISVGFPWRFRRTSQYASEASPTSADRDERADGFAALLPDQDPQDDTAHAHDGEGRADQVDVAGPGVGARRGPA